MNYNVEFPGVVEYLVQDLNPDEKKKVNGKFVPRQIVIDIGHW